MQIISNNRKKDNKKYKKIKKNCNILVKMLDLRFIVVYNTIINNICMIINRIKII